MRAYQAMVDDYNAGTEATDVEIQSWPDASAMMAEIAGGEPVPDLFLITRSALADVREAELNVPLLELLDERGVDYGDGYYRDAIEAFSGDDDLQCMPYGVSPMVIYYNTRLIDFERMRARELPGAGGATRSTTAGPSSSSRAAAEFASRPRRHTRGLYVEPSLGGLSPFIYAGGGEVYNDDNEPTSLAFSEDDTREALTESLELLRDPQVTLSDRQLAQRSALEWFKRGKLGMLPGFRELTPELRAVPNLDFDVMPMPTLDTAATIGDFTGLCISSESPYVSQAADFLVYAIGEEPLGRVAEAGYLAPSNLDVATSDAFLQPDQLPAHAGVFNASVERHGAAAADRRLPGAGAGGRGQPAADVPGPGARPRRAHHADRRGLARGARPRLRAGDARLRVALGLRVTLRVGCPRPGSPARSAARPGRSASRGHRSR